MGLIVIFSYGVGNASAANSSSIYVSTQGNDNWDGQYAIYQNNSIDGPKLSIKNAIGTVTTDGTVNIANGIYKGVNNTNITINKNLAINGQSKSSTIINGTGKNWIFNIPIGISVTLTNLTFTNSTSNNGSAIYNNGTVNVFNSTFSYNNASSYGSAIYNGGSAIISSSTFSNNNASMGTIYNIGTLIVSNSNFNNNFASYWGGAIVNEIDGTLTVNNSTFSGNNAQGAGAIGFFGNTSIVNNSNFIGNKAFYGGAIENSNILTITCSTFTNNSVNGSGGYTYGGAIDNSGTINIADSTFTNDTATYFGGAIENSNILTSTNNTFLNNAGAYGGAIDNSFGGIGTINVTNNTFNNNTASFGGAMMNEGGNVTVSSSRFTNNVAAYGGALDNYDAMSANFCSFANNTAYDGEGGTIWNANLNMDASLNWWGSNAGPSPADVYGNVMYGNVTTTPWLVLNISTNPTTILNGDNSTITIDLLHDSNGTVHDPANGHLPDGIPVTFTTTLGSINNSSTVNGSAQSIFNSEYEAGTAIITATVDNQPVQIPVTIIDTIPPIVNITNPVSSGYVGNIVYINVNATDNGGVTQVVFNTSSGYNFTDNNGSDGWNCNWDTTNLPDGVYNITAAAYDAANNTQSQTISVNVDNTLPTVTTSLPGGIYNTFKNVTLTANDNNVNPIIYYSTNYGYSWNHQTNNVTVNLAEYEHTIMYYAIDIAGNQCPIQTIDYTIDTIPPTAIKIYTQSRKSYNNTTRSIFIYEMNLGTIYYTIDGTNSNYI